MTWLSCVKSVPSLQLCFLYKMTHIYNIVIIFRSSPVHIFGSSNSLHSYARPPLASSAPNPSRGHLRERRRVRVNFPILDSPVLWLFTAKFMCNMHSEAVYFNDVCIRFFFMIYNRPAVNRSQGFSQCPHHFLMTKTWPGLTPGPPQPGIAS